MHLGGKSIAFPQFLLPFPFSCKTEFSRNKTLLLLPLLGQHFFLRTGDEEIKEEEIKEDEEEVKEQEEEEVK